MATFTQPTAKSFLDGLMVGIYDAAATQAWETSFESLFGASPSQPMTWNEVIQAGSVIGDTTNFENIYSAALSPTDFILTIADNFTGSTITIASELSAFTSFYQSLVGTINLLTGQTYTTSEIQGVVAATFVNSIIGLDGTTAGLSPTDQATFLSQQAAALNRTSVSGAYAAAATPANSFLVPAAGDRAWMASQTVLVGVDSDAATVSVADGQISAAVAAENTNPIIMVTTPIAATAFLSTLGVNVHLEEGTADYGNLSDVIADLNYLGINQVRDDITNGTLLPASSYSQLANAGVHFDFISDIGAVVTTASLASTVATIAAINAVNPGSVIAVEGPNEINNFSTTFNGVGGTKGAVELQQQLYSDVHSNANLAGVAVYYFTGYGQTGVYASTPLAVGPNPSTTAGMADYDNGHPYPQDGQAPYSWISLAGVPNEVPSSLLNESAPYGPFVFTETGYSSDDVSLTVQAQYTIDLLFDAASQGSSKTFLYELMDEGDGMGLFKCRSNKGAPGMDCQDFADIEAYGVERWLGELALALRQATYRPEPIRRVFIPKANAPEASLDAGISQPDGLRGKAACR